MINKEETDINSKFFKKIYFSFQRSSKMLKVAYSTNNRRGNKKLENVIKDWVI